jgi:hypothetical protein
MNDRRDGLLALCLFALLFSVYLLTFSGIYHSSDEMSMLAVTDSLGRRGAWDIELLRWMGEQQGSFGRDGLLYSRKGIGTTLVALPHYWLALQEGRMGNVQTAMLTNNVVTALTGVLVYLLLRRLGYSQGVGLGVALAFGLGTMAWPYARYLFSESLAGLGLLLCFYFLVRYRDQGDGASPLWAGAGLGLALLARLNNAIVASFLGLLLLYYLYHHEGRNWQRWVGRLVLFALPVLAALMVTGCYNWLRFGSPLTTGYLPEERFATPFLEGFYGLTFSPGKGLFWYNPILFAALIAWPAFFRRHQAEALLVAAAVLSNVAFYASWFLWWAGHAWGPRFLVTILPFAILPLAPALQAAKERRWLVAGLAALASVSVAVQLLGVAVNFNLYLEEIYAELGLYHPATLFSVAYSPLLRQIAYLRPENLDLAWARGGTVKWGALACGLSLVGLCGLALWAAWRGRLGKVVGAGLPFLLAFGALISLLLYSPSGDAAKAASLLARMERPGEAAALTEPLLTEPFQDAYDGDLPVRGAKTDPGSEIGPLWIVGPGERDPAAARFQVGTVRLDYYPPSGQQFDDTRLQGGLSPSQPRLGDLAVLAAWPLPVDSSDDELHVRSGEALPLTLYWRALAPTATDYTVFVQVIDEVGSKAGQLDRPPCNGGCPTTSWRPGDLIGEWLEIPIHVDAPPGRYQVIVGMYDLATGERLPWFDAEGVPLGDSLRLDSVQVLP